MVTSGWTRRAEPGLVEIEWLDESATDYYQPMADARRPRRARAFAGAEQDPKVKILHDH